MDRNSLIGFLLIGLIFIGYIYYFSPEPSKKPEKKEEKTTEQQKSAVQPRRDQQPETTPDQSESELTQKADKASKRDTVSRLDTINLPEPFASKAVGEEEEITIENEVMKIRLTSKGGFIEYAELKKYKDFKKDPLVLIDSSSTKLGYNFFYKNQQINTANLYFTPKDKSVKVSGNDSATVSMVMRVGEGHYIEQQYTIHGSSYMLDYDLNIVGFNKIIPRNTQYLNLEWVSRLNKQEQSMERERNRSGIIFKYANDEVDWLSEHGSGKRDISSSLKWVSFKQQFFSQTLIADESFSRGLVESSQKPEMNYLEKESASLTIPYGHKPREQFGMRLYIGPNHYQTLNKYDLQLEEQLSLGWFFIGWINKFIIIPVFNFLDNFIPNYGLIIIILTILIKLVLTPLTYKSFMSQAKMRALKPELDQLKEKHGNDMQKMQMEQMKLYRKAGINPMGGCFPMLLQLPFLIAMFHFYPASIELRQEGFLWAHDLSTFDSIWNFPGGFSIPFYGDHVSLFTILMAGSTMLYSWYNQKMTPTSNDQMGQQMKIMTYIMPFFILFIFNGYSAGLSCYYFFYNIFSFLQTYLFKQFVNEDKVRQQIEEKKKKPAKKSKFQQRLEDMAKQQQEMKQQQKGKNKKKK